jgi:uncharacterized protein involved in exopolysaccharide biosynthesis
MSRPDSLSSNEIDLAVLLRELGAARWRIALITSIATVVGLTYAWLATEWFRVDVVMVSADKGGMSARAGQLGGLASLAGININSEGSAEPLAVLKSKEFAATFIFDNDLTGLLTDTDGSSNAKPDIRKATEFFDENIRTVAEDKKNGTVTLSIEWIDPGVAAMWANTYVDKLNERLRAEALAEAEKNVAFLQKEIAATEVVQLRQSLGVVLESEMQKYLLASGNNSFAFKVVDKASAPLKATKPNRPAIVLIAFFLGLILSITDVLYLRPIIMKL